MITQYVIQCYDDINQANGAINIGQAGPTRFPVNVLAFAKSENEAIAKARKYVERNSYRLLQIQEFLDADDQIKGMRKQPWERT